MNKNKEINQHFSLDHLGKREMTKVLEKLHYKRSRIDSFRKNKHAHKNKRTLVRAAALSGNQGIYSLSKYQILVNRNNRIPGIGRMKKIKNLFIVFPSNSNDDRY